MTAGLDAGRELHFDVERFLVGEALALDEGRFEDWLDLLDDDVRYRVVAGPGPESWRLPYLDEDRGSLRQRVERMALGNAWAEVPPSRTQRFVTNVLVREEAPDGLRVHSGLLLYRSRLEAEVELFAGRRDDVLRRDGSGFQLADRVVTLAINSLPGKNASVFL